MLIEGVIRELSLRCNRVQNPTYHCVWKTWLQVSYSLYIVNTDSNLILSNARSYIS